jgi:hypothetical protein
VWIWEQTAIISLYSINWLFFITETECLLRGTDLIIKTIISLKEVKLQDRPKATLAATC